MTKAPKRTDSRAKALAGMTKAELVKTIRALDRKQTQLLNRIAKLETQPMLDRQSAAFMEATQPAPRMPWEMPNPFEGGE